jgi:hypothetical protein
MKKTTEALLAVIKDSCTEIKAPVIERQHKLKDLGE